MESTLLADLMLFNIETAQQYNRRRPQSADAFFKSIANSYGQAVDFIITHGLEREFRTRLLAIMEETEKQGWYNLEYFEGKGEEVRAKE